MVNLLPSLLVAGTASAQITTSLWMFKSAALGTEKVGYVGSVIGVSGTTTTLALDWDEGVDRNAFGLSNRSQTFTVGPSAFVYASTRRFAADRTVYSNDFRTEITCTQSATPTSAKPTCIASYGPYLARVHECRSGVRESRTAPYTTHFGTVTHTYPARGTVPAGTETFTRVVTVVPKTTPAPAWCSDQSYLPRDGYVTSVAMEREDFALYQLVLTAGLEKLNATATNATTSGANPTAASSLGSPIQNTGAAMPMKTVGPAVAGLGAALAIFL